MANGGNRGRWKPGQSGNPAGRPVGSRNAGLVLLDQMGTERAGDVLKKCIDAALAGDMRAAELLLSRCWPARRGRPVSLDLPAIDGAEGLLVAMSRVTGAVAAGELSADEGAAVAGILETHRRAIETADLDRRLRALENSEPDGGDDDAGE